MEQVDILIKISGELVMKILVNKLIQFSKIKDYILELVKMIFKYPQIIKHSTTFFNFLLLSYVSPPKKHKSIEESIKNFCNIKNSKEPVLSYINEKLENNPILKEIIIYIFEFQINLYFRKQILKTKKKKLE